MGRDTSPLKPVSRTAATGTERPNPSKTSNRIIGVLSAVTRPLIMDCRPSRKPDVGRRIADANRPGHGTGTSVEEAAGGIRITFAYLVVAGVDIYDHEFSILSRLNQRSNSALVDCRATGRKVCGYPLNRTDAHAVMLTRPSPGVTAPNQRSTSPCITEARIGHPEQQWYITFCRRRIPHEQPQQISRRRQGRNPHRRFRRGHRGPRSRRYTGKPGHSSQGICLRLPPLLPT